MPAKVQPEKKKTAIRSEKTTALYDETEFLLIDWQLIQPDPDQPRKEMGTWKNWRLPARKSV